MTLKTPAQMLTQIGTALYGERWQRPLAEELNIQERQIRRWLSGTFFTADSPIFADAALSLGSRADHLKEMRKEVNRWLSDCRQVAAAELHFYDTAMTLLMDDDSLRTMSFDAFCRRMWPHAKVYREMRHDLFRAALQSAWEKVHV